MANDALTQKAAEVIGQLQGLAPKATEVALEAVRYGALADIISALVFIPILAATVWCVRAKYLPWAKEDDFEPASLLAGIALGVWTLICVAVVAAGLLNPWNYIALAHPEVYAAHQIILAATK